jgi:type I restriction enzyme S subunit
MSKWLWVPLADLAEVNPSRPLKKGVVYPYLAMEDVSTEFSDPTSLSFRPWNGSGSKFQKGDVLLARITPSAENGKTALVTLDMAHGSTELTVLAPKDPGIMDSLFLFYLLKDFHIRNQLIDQMTGTTGRQRIPNDAFDNILVPLPPLPVQRRIAEILGSVDEVSIAQKTLIEKLSLLMDNIMHEHFSRSTEHRTTIGDIAEVQTGPFGSLLKSSSFTSKGVPVLNIGNVHQGFLDKTSLSFVNETTASALKNYRLKQGDLLFSRMATVGRTCTVPEDADGWLMSYHLIRLRLRSEYVLPQYLTYSLIGSPRIKHQVSIESSGGTRSGVNTSILEGLVIDVPNLDTQRKVVNCLDLIQERIAHGKLLIERYETLRANLLRTLLANKSREVAI